ncbi:MAG: hypothetical protein ABSG16_17140 [Candidatus Acidiferrum sp.]
MKIASLISRLLLGLIFLVFGLNGFLQFLHMPPPTGLALQFVGVLFASHFYVLIFGVQVLGGLFLFVAPAGLPLAFVVALLWSIVAIRNKQQLSGIFAPGS